MPIFFLISFINSTHLKKAQEVQLAELTNITKILAAENKQFVEGARQLLITVSTSPEIKNQNVCKEYLSNLLSKYQRYSNIGVTNELGFVTCSAIPPPGNINLSDRYFFQETVRTNNFTVGEYVVSRTTSKSSINFGYPIPGSQGVIYATLDLTWLNNAIQSLILANDRSTVVLILDRTGKILARSPDPENWVGKVFPNDPLLNNLTKEFGIIEASGIDKIDRVYAFQKIGELDAGPFVLVGQEKDKIFSGPIEDYEKVLFLSILTALFSIAVGFLVGNSLISKTLEKVREFEGLKKDFISLVSHQLRTPVTSIKWFTEILASKKTGVLNQKQKNLLNDIKISTERITSLIKILLDISKLESKKLSVSFEKINLKEMIVATTKELKLSFNNKHIKTNIRYMISTPLNLVADNKLLKQVLVNLLHNAFKYSRQGGEITITVKKVGKIVRIEIKDLGIGIPANESANLFQKFSRASNARLADTEGAGLGLYLSKLVIEQHGGKIGIGKTKKGALVFFTIPLTLNRK